MTFLKPHVAYKCGYCGHVAKGKDWKDEEWWCEDCQDDHNHDVCPSCEKADHAERVKLGRTADAMAEADQGAIYVWCNSRLAYPRDLAKHLDRGDLRIVSSLDIEGMAPEQNKQLVIDHACVMSGKLWNRVVMWRNVKYPGRYIG